jgi:hypothetical protein
MERERGRAGQHGGGWLKSGNTVNVGRKPSEVRAEILSTVGEAAAMMRSILDGEFKQEVRNGSGKVVCRRSATISEVVLVWRALAQHALAAKADVAVWREPPPEQPSNWTLLSRADKSLFMELLEKADAIAKGEIPRPVDPPAFRGRMGPPAQ